MIGGGAGFATEGVIMKVGPFPEEGIVDVIRIGVDI
jgi:hypothetical protein